MEIREWAIILGVVVGVAFLFWVAARWRKRRYEDVFDYDPSETEEMDLEYGSELPSGGARTVGYRDPSDIERLNGEIRQRADTLKPRLSSFSARSSEQQTPSSESQALEPDQKPAEIKPKTQTGQPKRQVPLLLDPSDEHSQEEVNQTSFQSVAPDADGVEPELKGDAIPNDVVPEQRKNVSHNSAKAPDIADSFTVGKKRGKSKSKERFKSKGVGKKKELKTAEGQDPAEIIMINLMTGADSPYQGATLWRALNEVGMRFGEMDIFHYCGKQGDELPQFRMANLLNPGFFDLDKFDQLRTHALCFFFELEPEQDNIAIFESMLSVIRQLKDELGGDIRDDQRSVFTIQTSEHSRNKIREFQRRRLVKRG